MNIHSMGRCNPTAWYIETNIATKGTLVLILDDQPCENEIKKLQKQYEWQNMSKTLQKQYQVAKHEQDSQLNIFFPTKLSVMKIFKYCAIS